MMQTTPSYLASLSLSLYRWIVMFLLFQLAPPVARSPAPLSPRVTCPNSDATSPSSDYTLTLSTSRFKRSALAMINSTVPYSWKCWQELNWAVGPQVAIAKYSNICGFKFGSSVKVQHTYNICKSEILVDFNLSGRSPIIPCQISGYMICDIDRPLGYFVWLYIPCFNVMCDLASCTCMTLPSGS